MTGASTKEITGAWVIHHGRKLMLDANGSAEFPAIDEASKAATLLTKLGQTNQAEISKDEVRAIAVASSLNPRYELDSLLKVLEQKRLIDQSSGEVSVLGVTTRGSLGHAADMYNDADPNPYERASVTLAEIASSSPVRKVEAKELIGDQHKLTLTQADDFLRRAEEIGFVDQEGDGDDRLLFNGNLLGENPSSKARRF
jgi:hypothetical protein